MKTSLYISLIFFFLSCSNGDNIKDEANKKKSIANYSEIVSDSISKNKVKSELELEFYIQERLPFWFLETNLLNGLSFADNYKFDLRINPFYFESDFNGDEKIDIAIPIKENKSGKLGFAIIHGGTNEVFIIGAGTKVKNLFSDNLDYIDIWLINRNHSNEQAIGNKAPLILKNSSLLIEKSEVGGGLIFWNGKTYEYFHQTC